MPENKVPWIVGAVLVVVLAIGALAFTKKKEKEMAPMPPPDMARALVLPANRARTVVVAPCGTPVRSTARAAAKGQGVPGATEIKLPRGRGMRTVLVPHCQPNSGATDVEGSIPSALFVLAGRKRLTEREGTIASRGVVAKSQLILPNGSPTSTVVVPPCTGKSERKRRQAIIRASGGSAGLQIAPSC